MNIIKENLFFVVMGAVVLLALVLFVVIVQPLKGQNNVLEAKVRGLVEDMDQIVDKNTKTRLVLPNQAAMNAARTYQLKWQVEDNDTVEWMSKMHLRETLETLDPALAEDPGAYKFVYDKSVQEIQKKLSDKKIATTADTWHFWDWAQSVPKDPLQRVMAAKEFALTAELVNVVMSGKLHVIQLDRLEINPDEQRNGDYKPLSLIDHPEPALETYFDVYPFVLEVRMPVDRYELFIGELLHPGEGVPIFIRDVSMSRIEDDPKLAAKAIPPLFVGVRVDGWALDYRRHPRPAAATTQFMHP